MPRKSSRGRRPQSRRSSGGSLITWLLILLLIAVIALIALPHFQQTPSSSADTTAPTRATEDKPSSDETGGGVGTGRSRSLPADNRVLERPGNTPSAPPSAAEDQEANEVAAMVSQGVVKYDRATRNPQDNAATPAPAREAQPR